MQVLAQRALQFRPGARCTPQPQIDPPGKERRERSDEVAAEQLGRRRVWLGNMIPPEPMRMREVALPICASTTEVAPPAMPSIA